MRIGPILAAMAGLSLLSPIPPAAQAPAPPASPGCALTGSPNVSVEGRGMLNLGDVQACPGLRYEIIPHVIINGLPAVRLLPSDEASGSGASGSGANSVTVGGAPAARQGDVR